MFDTRTVRHSIRYLFRGGIHEHGWTPEAVGAALQTLNYQSLAEVCERDARRVFAFETRGRHPLDLLYRGQDLFGQRALRIYEDVDAYTSGSPLASHALEVWLKEDGNLITTACVRIRYSPGDYNTDYREIRGWPWGGGCDLELKLDDLTEQLRQLYCPGVQ